MKTVLSKVKSTLEEINSRLDEAEDQMSNLENKVEKDTKSEQQKGKDFKKMRTD